MSDQNPPIEYVPPPPPRAVEPDVLLVLFTGFAFGIAVWNLATRLREIGSGGVATANVATAKAAGAQRTSG